MLETAYIVCPSEIQIDIWRLSSLLLVDGATNMGFFLLVNGYNRRFNAILAEFEWRSVSSMIPSITTLILKTTGGERWTSFPLLLTLGLIWSSLIWRDGKEISYGLGRRRNFPRGNYTLFSMVATMALSVFSLKSHALICNAWQDDILQLVAC